MRAEYTGLIGKVQVENAKTALALAALPFVVLYTPAFFPCAYSTFALFYRQATRCSFDSFMNRREVRIMVEVKNFFQEVENHAGIRNFKLWKTEFSTFWIINSEPKIQDDMHYHENDDHVFMVLEGEGVVRTPHKEYALKQFDLVVLTAGQPYQLCNTGEGRLLLLGAGNSGADGKPRTRVPRIASHTPVTEPVIA
jgi:mannose-6-phosphate isomerase-like protein (cupin superfamily)